MSGAPKPMRVRVESHGSIVLIRPLDATARAWLEEHTDGQWWGDALACEPRYVSALLDGFDADGGLVHS